MKFLPLGLLFLIATPALAQLPSPERYRVKILTLNGERLFGTLYSVDEARLQFLSAEVVLPLAPESVPLESIKKVVLYRDRRREAAWQGAAVGAVALGLITFRSLERNPPQSRVVFGLSLGLGTGAGALFGSIIGSGVSRSLQKRVIRPSLHGDARASLRSQLLPFAYTYQSDFLHDSPP